MACSDSVAVVAENTNIKKLRCTRDMQQLMAAYFRDLGEASVTSSRKIAWCTSVGPVELLRALGFAVYFPENHAAMLGASRKASSLISAANAIGYSPDVCSYLTSDIGSFLRGQTAISQPCGVDIMPAADVLVYNTNQCRDVQQWFSFYQHRFNVPMFGVDTPRNIGTVSAELITYVRQQLQCLADNLQTISKRKLDIDELRSVVACSHRCSQTWNQVLSCAKHRPSPLTFFDAIIHMAPAVVMRGTTDAVSYYQKLLQELNERIDCEVAAVSDERFRLYWEGMPIWGKIRSLAQLLASQQCCAVASTYCQSWVFDALDNSDPFEAMATAYTELFIVRDDPYKQAYLGQMADCYGIDGFVFHDAKTCPNNSNNRYALPEELSHKLHIPHIVIHADLNDLRMYSEEQTHTAIEALVEQLRNG